MVSAAMGVVAAGWIIGKFTMAAAEDTSRCVSDVVERDLSCRTRISSFSESPGQPRYGSGSARWTVWDFNSAGHSIVCRKSPHPETHSKTGLCMVMQKRSKICKRKHQNRNPVL